MQSLPTISSGLVQMLQWITLAPVLLPYLDAARSSESHFCADTCRRQGINL